jgi:hypothetical protein
MARWLQFGAEELGRDFDQRPIAFSHRFHQLPLFELQRLAELAERLLAGAGKRDVYNAVGRAAPGERFGDNRAAELSPGETIKAIATADSWVVLKRVERDPEFRPLVEACAAEIGAAIPVLAPPDLLRAEGFIFVTSPHAVTPYHIDPQWPFLAQIRGEKLYTIYDATVVSEPEIEDWHAGDVMAAKYAPEKEPHGRTFRLRPGDALTQPVYAPHVARVGADYSITFSVAFVSKAWAKHVPLRLANRALRRAGLKPAPIGEKPLLDSAKSFTWRAAARIGREVRGSAERVRSPLR